MSKKVIKKNNNKPIIINNDSPADQFKSLIIILGVILIVLILFYGITLWIKYEKKNNIPSEKVTAIDYKKILLSNILNYSGEYYIIATFKENQYKELYETYLSQNEKKYYNVDLSDSFNNKYIADVSNLKVDQIIDLKISKETIFHIVEHKIINVYEGKEVILSYLESLEK